MSSALVTYPGFGSVWLEHAHLITAEDGRDYVVGWSWDDSGVGSPYMPDDYQGEEAVLNFPATCIRKVVDGPLKHWLPS